MCYLWNMETVYLNDVLVPCVEMGESFRYLGRYFDFNMSNSQHTSELSSHTRVDV